MPPSSLPLIRWRDLSVLAGTEATMGRSARLSQLSNNSRSAPAAVQRAFPQLLTENANHDAPYFVDISSTPVRLTLLCMG
jgi:hypothetical protein